MPPCLNFLFSVTCMSRVCSSVHTFLSSPLLRICPLSLSRRLWTADRTCHGAPPVAPWHALPVSLTLARIGRGAPSALEPTRALDLGCWPTSSVNASNIFGRCVHYVLDATAARPAACCRRLLSWCSTGFSKDSSLFSSVVTPPSFPCLQRHQFGVLETERMSTSGRHSPLNPPAGTAACSRSSVPRSPAP